jgi:hypothetical protein
VKAAFCPSERASGGVLPIPGVSLDKTGVFAPGRDNPSVKGHSD